MKKSEEMCEEMGTGTEMGTSMILCFSLKFSTACRLKHKIIDVPSFAVPFLPQTNNKIFTTIYPNGFSYKAILA